MAIGRPISLTPNIATKAINSVATANQTDFTVTGGYRINELAVYRNGVRLAQGRDFTANDGSTVTLTNGATLNDVIEFVVFDSFNVAGTIVSAASSQTLSGDLNVTGKLYGGTVDTDSLNIGVGTFVSAVHVGTAITIDAAGNTNTTGIVTAASFSGDGSALTGINTSTIVSVATTTGLLNVTGTTDSTSSTTGSVTIAGGVGIAKNVYIGAGLSVAGTLTYEDVTNVDSVGLITAKSGVNITGGQLTVGSALTIGSAGVATFIAPAGVGVTITPSTGKVEATTYYGDGSNLTNITSTTINSNADNRLISGSGTANTLNGESNLTFDGSTLTVTGAQTVTGDLFFDNGDDAGKDLKWDSSVGALTFEDEVLARFGSGADLTIRHVSNNSYIENNAQAVAVGNLYIRSFYQENGLVLIPNGAVEAYYDNSKKFETTNDGTSVTGIATATVGIDAAISVWTLGANSTNHYTFTGPGNLSATDDPTLNLIRGQKYTFKNRSGGHPFRIQSTINGSTGTQYSTGVTNNDGGDGTNIIFDVPYDAPAVLYYQCTSHANMGGAMYISGSGYETKIGTGITIAATSGVATFADGSNVTNGLHFGSGADLRIYADGSNSRIDHNGDGNLRIFSGGAESIKCVEGANVSLFHNGTEMCYTHASGLKLNDDKKLLLGTGSDLELYHDATNSRIHNSTGDLIFRTEDNFGFYNSAGNATLATFTVGASVELYEAGTKRFETTTSGVTINGSVTDTKGNLRSIPKNNTSGSYTLVAADAGKQVLATGTVTIPNSIFSEGDAVTIINNSGSDITLTASVGTLYNTSDAATGNRTLAGRGMATIIFSTATVAYISGAGLS